ncbi:hypothetical protein FRX31_004746, partial [Thalictrum thalictroides]
SGDAKDNVFLMELCMVHWLTCRVHRFVHASNVLQSMLESACSLPLQSAVVHIASQLLHDHKFSC